MGARFRVEHVAIELSGPAGVPVNFGKTRVTSNPRLGATNLAHLHIGSREDAFSPAKIDALDDAKAVFFTGGDQLRITSRIGGAPACDRIREVFAKGGVIAGPSSPRAGGSG